jgi:hypothetical protein
MPFSNFDGLPEPSFSTLAYVLLMRWMIQMGLRLLRRSLPPSQHSSQPIDPKPDFQLHLKQRTRLMTNAGIYMKLAGMLANCPGGKVRDRRIFFRILSRRNWCPQMTPTCFATVPGCPTDIRFTERSIFVCDRGIRIVEKEPFYINPRDPIQSVVLPYVHRDPITRIVIDPSLRIIVGVTVEHIYIWHVDSVGNILGTERQYAPCVKCLEFYPNKPDTPILVSICYGTIYFEEISFNPLACKKIKLMDSDMHPKQKSFSEFRFNESPGFPFFLTISCAINEALLWRHSEDFSMVVPVASLGGDEESIRIFEFLKTSPDLVVTAGEFNLNVWRVTPLGDVQHLQKIICFDPSAEIGICRIAINPKLPMIAVGSYRHPTKIFIILPTGKLVLVAVLDEEICEGALEWDVDGKTLAIVTLSCDYHLVGRYTYSRKKDTRLIELQ